MPGHSPADALLNQIVADYETRILEHQLKPGDKMPSESDISNEYMVSRSIVRRAFRKLERRGLVDATQGRGRYVRCQRLRLDLPRSVKLPLPPSSNLGTYRSETRHVGLTRASKDVARVMQLSDRADVVAVERLFYINDIPIGLIRQQINAARIPDFMTLFEEVGGSVSRALAAAGVTEVERPTASLTARLPEPDECSAVNVPPHAPMLIVNVMSRDAKSAVEVSELRLPSDRIEIGLLPG